MSPPRLQSRLSILSLLKFTRVRIPVEPRSSPFPVDSRTLHGSASPLQSHSCPRFNHPVEPRQVIPVRSTSIPSGHPRSVDFRTLHGSSWVTPSSCTTLPIPSGQLVPVSPNLQSHSPPLQSRPPSPVDILLHPSHHLVPPNQVVQYLY